MTVAIEPRGSQALREQVWARDLCSNCGACAGMCPYHVAYRGRIVSLDECTLPQGRCYAFCPRTAVDLDSLNNAVAGANYDPHEPGSLRRVLMSRAADERVRAGAQHGGTVTALVAFALRSGLIDSAVLTSSDRSLVPAGTVARDGDSALAAARSNFVAGPTLESLNRELRGSARRIGVVATPCQSLALAKMRASTLEDGHRRARLSLVIGLFCTWALDGREFLPFLAARVPLAEVVKVDVPPPPAGVLQVWTQSDTFTIPLDEVRRFVLPACRLCLDMTAEFADVSVGAAEGIEGWNTLIVRTEAGAALAERAQAAGAIDTEPLREANVTHLREAALIKKRRALANIAEAAGGDDLLYLEPSRGALAPLRPAKGV